MNALSLQVSHLAERQHGVVETWQPAGTTKQVEVALALNDVVRLQQTVRGRTRSDAEAQFLILCHEHGITLPLVNHRLNGSLTDFHRPEPRLVLEVDGWEFHEQRAQFEEDRRRELVHAAHGWQGVRAGGAQVMREPELVLAALQTTGW